MENSFEKIKSLVSGMEVDAEKAYSGNKAAGVRLRKSSMELRELCKSLKKETLELSSSK